MKRKLLFSILLPLFAIIASAQTTRYVSAGATGDGSSWSNASGDLQLMINQSAANDQIWVKAGIYKPNRPANDPDNISENNRDNAFVLKAGVKIYGGFAGTENTLAGRNWQSNETVLSGDFNDNDVVNSSGTSLTISNNSENAYHVVISAGNMGTAVLDGFTIKGGNASVSSQITVNSVAINRSLGGGMYNANTNSALTISNCSFLANRGLHGGGMYNLSSSPAVMNCTFQTNLSANNGAGMYNISASSPVINNCVFTGNFSFATGGGIINQSNSSPAIRNSVFSANRASSGGGIYSDGNSSPTIANSVFSGNSATINGGGIHNAVSTATIINTLVIGNNAANGGGGIYNAASSNSTIINTTIAGNNAATNGGGMLNFGSTSWAVNPKIYNSILIGNTSGGVPGISNNAYATPNIQYSLVQGIAADAEKHNLDGTTILPGDVFANWIDPGGRSTATVEDYALKTGSPVIDKGSATLYNQTGTAATDKDLAGNPRLFGTEIDLGSFEFGSSALPVSFGPVSAIIQNGDLLVQWSTASETNNDHFLVQASKDGSTWKTIATIKSKAENGNSNSELKYEYRIPFNSATAIAALSVLIFSLFAVKKRNPASVRGGAARVTAFGMALCILAFLHSCSKNEIHNLDESDKMFIRIVQVDKDGTQKESKVVQAVRH